MWIKYLDVKGNITDEKVDHIEFHSCTLAGEDKEVMVCKRSIVNPWYIDNDCKFEVETGNVFIINP